MQTAFPQTIQKLWLRTWPMLIILVPCVLLALGGEPVRDALRYDRGAILHGQAWRIFTGNFVHLGWSHLGEDMAGYVLLWLLLEDVLPAWRCPLMIGVGALGVGVGLLMGDPQLRWYVGISGALNTLWLAGAMQHMRQRDWLGWALGGFLILKLIYEQSWGPLPWSVASTGGPVVVDAHLYGALTGALMGLVFIVLGGRKARARYNPRL